MTHLSSIFRRAVPALTATALCAAALPMTGNAARTARTPSAGDAALNLRGLTIQARPRGSSLRAVDVRFTSGAEIRLTSASSARVYATYVGDLGSVRQYFGVLEIPAHKSSGTFRLRFRAMSGQYSRSVTATLTAGSKPALHLSGFPAGTTRFELNTAGAGKSATRTTKCTNKIARYHGTMSLTLRSGAKEPGHASGEVSCAKLPPAG
ncbi:hypothetical protein [Baekduia sp.]|jgi:hypothetical protein|uniref:hypothetical protein n=1 Tax=Baekduia sp. TaxID=2600305 RepID=UPI002E05FA1A|nr:hypothetical protein [Baekduia sp.]